VREFHSSGGLVAGLLAQRPELNPRAVHVTFIVEEVVSGQFLSENLGNSSTITIPTNAPYASVRRVWCNTTETSDSRKSVINTNIGYRTLKSFG
jgi:hypothetical protein